MKSTKHGVGLPSAVLQWTATAVDVLVAMVIAILAAVWIVAFAGFWIWGALT